ncbi:MAG: hypothetical protein RMJ98_08745 [Myxococcales bacterium]|nr:hypothetical protein [Polyangiaceae bacterium]MDW8249376.1 hypothetical protein [Myxococcales bacterium]
MTDPHSPPLLSFPWGCLIQRELAALTPLLAVGCFSPPPPTAPSFPPPVQVEVETPPPITPVPDNGEAKIGVEPLVELETALKEEAEFPYNFVYHAVPSGAGVFSFYQFEQEYSRDGAPACSIKTPYPEVCAAFSFARWKGEALWPRGWLPHREASRLEPDGKLVPSPARWQRFSPGQKGVYAVREISPWGATDEPLVIDLLHPDGSIEVFLKDDSGRFSDAAVVEVPGGHLGIFRRAPIPLEDRLYRSVGSLVAAPIVSTGKERRIGDLEDLQIGDVWFDGRASDARDARKISKRAGYGPFLPVALTNTSGQPTGEVVLLWVEAIPPPGYSEQEAQDPRSESPKGKGKNQCGRPSAEPFRERVSRRRPTAQDGCGGRTSRMLSSTDVKKRLHLTRLSSTGRLGADRVVDLPASYDAERSPLRAYATPDGGLVVGEMTFDKQLRRGRDISREAAASQALEPPVLRGAPPQRLLSATFDPASGEAAIIYAEAIREDIYPRPPILSDAPKARAVSALGKPLGQIVELPEFRDLQWEILAARGGDSWVLLSREKPSSFRILGGPHHGAQHPLPIPECGPNCTSVPLSLLPAPGAHVEVIWSGQYDGSGPFSSTLLHPATLLSDPPQELKERGASRFVFDDRGAFRSKEGTLATWYLREDGSAVLLHEGERPPEGADTWHRFTREVHQVWGDVVIVAAKEKQIRATWLKAGVTIDIEPDKISRQQEEQKLRAGEAPGPVLPGGKWLLPSAPGQPIPAPAELQTVLQNCPVRLPTGPRRMLLACSEATNDQLPTVRVGTRVVRY